MTAEHWWTLFVMLALPALIGYITGQWIEQAAWLRRARDPSHTAHYCDGVFWVIIPESEFCREWQRKPINPPKGGSGTAPPKRTDEPRPGGGSRFTYGEPCPPKRVWRCENPKCGANFGEYVNGCPMCEAGKVACITLPSGWSSEHAGPVKWPAS